MGEPEHIAVILARVFADLERKYQKSPGARSLDPCGDDALTIISGAPSLSGKENEPGLDKALPKTS